METILRLNITEIDSFLLNALKKAFGKDHSIEISIKKNVEELDFLKPETKDEYFTRLKKAIKNVENGNVISFTGDEFEALSKKFLSKK